MRSRTHLQDKSKATPGDVLPPLRWSLACDMIELDSSIGEGCSFPQEPSFGDRSQADRTALPCRRDTYRSHRGELCPKQ